MPDQKKYINGDNLVKYDEIIKDWVDDKVVELTQAEYDALTPAEKMNGTEYFITNGHSGGGTTDYDDLDNKPSINSVTLSGNKTATQLGLASASDLANKANGAGLTFSVDQYGILCVTY